MASSRVFFIFFIVLFLGGALYFLTNKDESQKITETLTDVVQENIEEIADATFPLSITNLRNGKYEGSDIVIEDTLDPGSNYSRYYVSYKSEGLKIFALLTVPNGKKPKSGWPVIVFNHGYIPPIEYKTTERYIAYVDGFARNGYIVLRPDYRGHDRSEGEPSGAYGSNGYTIDVLNATSSVKKYKDVDPQKIGMWGHSLGGFITLRNMVVRSDIKAGVIWAGVVASYPDLLSRWRRNPPRPTIPSAARGWRQTLIDQFGDPEKNPEFWNSISANSYVKDISGPLQLQHGTADSSVPFEFSETLAKQIKEAGTTVELYTYSGDDHNLSNNFNTAMQRSIDFFNKHLKK